MCGIEETHSLVRGERIENNKLGKNCALTVVRELCKKSPCDRLYCGPARWRRQGGKTIIARHETSIGCAFRDDLLSPGGISKKPGRGPLLSTLKCGCSLLLKGKGRHVLIWIGYVVGTGDTSPDCFDSAVAITSGRERGDQEGRKAEDISTA